MLLWPTPTHGSIVAKEISRENYVIKASRYEDGKSHGLFPSSCSRNVLQEVVKTEGSLQKFFNRCGKYLKVNSVTHPLLKYIRNRYPMTDERAHYLLTFNLRNGTKLKGIYVSNKLKTPSPLIIIKGGIYADSTFEGSPNNLLLQYARESPFNALYLESTTSKDFIRRNKDISFGGLIESSQLAEVLYELEHSKLEKTISEVHLVGNSLGGYGVLLIEQSIGEARQEGLAISEHFYPRSLTAHCPVINLKKSFINMFSFSLAGIMGTSYLRRILDGLRYDAPLIYKIFGDDDLSHYNRETLQSVMQRLNSESYRRFYLNRYGTRNYQMERDLYQANDVSNHIRRLTIPTYIIHAKNDHIVRYKDNLGELLRDHQNELPPNVHTLTLEEGDHCAFGHAYNWGHMTTLFKSIIYHHSKWSPQNWYYNIKRDFTQTARTIFGNPSIRFKSGDVIANYYFKKYRADKGLKLKFKIFRATRNEGNCRYQKYYDADSGCYDIESVYIKPSTLRRPNPRNEDEENSLIRRLNSQATLVDSAGLEIRGRAALPVELILER